MTPEERHENARRMAQERRHARTGGEAPPPLVAPPGAVLPGEPWTRSEGRSVMTIPQHKRSRGFDYYLAAEGEQAVVYRQDNARGTVGFEVFRRYVDPPGERTMGGTTFKTPGGLRWPSNEAFGKWAWTLRTEAEAMDKFWGLEDGA